MIEASVDYVSRAHEYAAAERPIRPVAEALGFGGPADLLYGRNREMVRYVRHDGQYYHVTLSGYTTAA